MINWRIVSVSKITAVWDSRGGGDSPYVCGKIHCRLFAPVFKSSTYRSLRYLGRIVSPPLLASPPITKHSCADESENEWPRRGHGPGCPVAGGRTRRRLHSHLATCNSYNSLEYLKYFMYKSFFGQKNLKMTKNTKKWHKKHPKNNLKWPKNAQKIFSTFFASSRIL